MRHYAFVDNGDGFKPTMRVFSHPTGMIRRLEVLRPRIIQHEKRADLAVEIVAGKEIPHGKPVAYHVSRARLIHADQFFHCHRFCGHEDSPSCVSRPIHSSICRSTDHQATLVKKGDAVIQISRR